MSGYQLKTVLQAEHDLIRSTLQFHNGNRTRSAKTLGITSNTLRNKMVQFGLSDDFRSLGGRPKNNAVEHGFAAEAASPGEMSGADGDIASAVFVGEARRAAVSLQPPTEARDATGLVDHVALSEIARQGSRLS